MNIQQVTYFIAVCEKGSFSKAAASLGVTLQALSISMSKLEAELGVSLFNRTGRGTVLTEHGKYLRPHATRIISEMEEVSSHFVSLKNESKELKIASSTGTIFELGISLISKFRAANPDIDLHLREYKDVMVDSMMLQDKAEVGIGLEPFDTEVFEYVRMFRQPMVLIMKEDHPLANFEKIPLGAIIDYPLFTVDEMFKSADNFLEGCRDRGVVLKPALRVGEVATVHQMVQKGEGIGLTVATVAKAYGTPGTTYRYFEEYEDRFYWTLDVFRKRSVTLSETGKKFYDFCVEYGKENLV